MEDELEDDHKYVVENFQKFLKDCSNKGIRTDLILHGTFCVLFDYALETAPSKESLFGLVASAMSAAHEANAEMADDVNGQQEEDPEDVVH
jgi:hypothetical protein